MATSEKPLYKNITITSPDRETPPSSKQYRGISTVGRIKNFNLFDIAIIKQDIINHFHIRQGEKLENPAFGTIIWDILFEPFTQDVQDAIVKNVTEIVNYDPRVNVEEVIVDTYESGIQIDCTFTYLPYSITETLRLRFDQKAGLI